ncbi:MAG: sensor domain-containing diguanylate cyclase [Planctomycetes bacterium]|nr:sensor domain-containing diguanylate cyclase [Planctomycetota bacterium]MCH9725720.1 sensor domain-containing diguanylate cyclase [Planctomycetota bacterium]MCH9777775.1 sensor domain-containing diguanylate cyclase [Planctomycetota bacterium]
MRNYYTAIQFWSYSLLVVCLCPLSVILGSHMGWPLGVTPLLLLAPVVVLAAISSPRICYWTITALAVGSCFAEIFFRTDTSEGNPAYLLSIMSAAVIIGLTLLIDVYIEKLNGKLSQVSTQNDELVRQLYESQKEPTPDFQKTVSQRDSNELQQNDSAENPEAEMGVNYPLLLLTLQDIGRRISTNQSNESLIPTVVSTAKASLQCEYCQVYLWDSKTRALKNALPARSRDKLDYRPVHNSGVAAWVIENRQIVMRNDAEQDYQLKRILEEDPHMPDAIAPLTVGSELIGLMIIDKVDVESPTTGRLLYILSNIYALGIKNSQLFKRIEEMASRDGLTGLYNHATFQEKLQEMVKSANNQSTSLSLVMSDIDHFKSFNDTYGHQAGDFVLKEVARIWNTVMPENAILARYGGEEFIGVLVDHEYSQAMQIAEDLRETLENCPMLFEGQQLQVTASFGVTELNHPASTTNELVKVADEYLYKAKESGRNQVAGLVPNSARKPST